MVGNHGGPVHHSCSYSKGRRARASRASRSPSDGVHCHTCNAKKIIYATELLLFGDGVLDGLSFHEASVAGTAGDKIEKHRCS